MSNPFETESKQSLEALLEAMNRDRERLRVQLNLAQKELRDEWQEVEQTWQKLEQTVAQATDDTSHLAHSVAEDLKAAFKGLEDKVKDM